MPVFKFERIKKKISITELDFILHNSKLIFICELTFKRPSNTICNIVRELSTFTV